MAVSRGRVPNPFTTTTDPRCGRRLPSRRSDSTKTGKTYYLGNILDGPAYGQIPRYPLALAEFDPASVCLVRDSVRIIQDRPDGAHEHVRYTNFGWYEDRKSGDLMITLPEQFRYRGYLEIEKPEDFAADCVKYAVELEA